MSEVTILPLVALGYLMGAIPFALLVARGMAGTDVRLAGSGNVGAANVFRTTRMSIGLVAMALDIGKGGGAVVCAGLVGADETGRAAAGLAAVVGHVYPVWLRFRGGKGVATACGVFSVLAPGATVVAAVLFVMLLFATRYVSLASIVSTIALPVFAYEAGFRPVVVLAACLAAALILFRHRSNLARLVNGTERRFLDR